MASYQSFFEDKQNFLNNIANNDLQYLSPVDKLNATTNHLSQKNYIFLSSNTKLLEQEFDQLFKVLKLRALIRDESRDEAAWLYCYYCAKMIEAYYAAYDKQDEFLAYQNLSAQIRQRYELGLFEPEARPLQEAFLSQVYQNIRRALMSLAETPQHISKLRNTVALTNIYRIYWIFCRLTVKQSLLMLKGSNLLKQFDALLNQQSDFDQFISVIEAPNACLRFASVALFASRFLIHAAMLTKHVFFPNEQQSLLSKKDRFYKEISKRQGDFLNDIVWGSVNSVTNFSTTFGLSASVASWIVAGFMSFDACLLLYRRQCAYQDYELKKQQYEHEIATAETAEAGLIVSEQLRLLNINWQATSATYYFNVSAALLIMSGFTASLILSQPPLILASYFVCALAVSMYLTGGEFFTYQEKRLLSMDSPADLALYAESQSAQSEFIQAISKQSLMPIVSLVLLSLSWQGALALTLLYMGYQAYQAWPAPREDALLPAPGNL